MADKKQPAKPVKATPQKAVPKNDSTNMPADTNPSGDAVDTSSLTSDVVNTNGAATDSGANTSSSTSLLDYLTQGSSAAANIIGALNGKPATAKPSAAAAAKSSLTTYLPWIAGAVALIVLVIFLGRKK